MLIEDYSCKKNNDVTIRYRSNSALYSTIGKTDDIATTVQKTMDKFATIPESIKYIELSDK